MPPSPVRVLYRRVVVPLSEQEVEAFLAQFDEARRDFDNWPKWMQDAAHTASATFPVTPCKPHFLIACVQCNNEGDSQWLT